MLDDFRGPVRLPPQRKRETPADAAHPQAHTSAESDPNGLDQHAPGAKLDAGKVRVDLVMSGFPLALLAVAEVATYGANKYSEHGWRQVPDGVKRYTAAKDRHRLLGAIEAHDPESNLLHAAHEAWNALAVLQLMLEAKKP